MKVVPFIPNEKDDLHCLQSCLRSVLEYFFPKRNFSMEEIEDKSGFNQGWTWMPPSVVWLNSLGLSAKLYLPSSSFDYQKFSDVGENYLKVKWSGDRYDREKRSGALNNLTLVQSATKEMIDKKLWVDKELDEKLLVKYLDKKNYLAIGKTIYDWLGGNNVSGNSHYVVLIKEYSPAQWRVHDPGLPPHADRKVPKSINNHSIFGDLILIKGNNK